MNSMYEIDVRDEQSLLVLSPDWIREVVSATLALEQVESAVISIAIVDNPTIWRLNRRHLQHDYPTDVLSFLFSTPPTPMSAVPPRGQGQFIEGEIIVSAEMAMEMAAQYDWAPQDELCLYVVHGLLHLCGYDDLTAAEQIVMRSRERDVLRIWNLTPHYAAESTVPPAESAT